jgi:hypothetical protein
MNSDLVWKDTVLVRTGGTVDVLLESGMMFSFEVAPASDD